MAVSAKITAAASTATLPGLTRPSSMSSIATEIPSPIHHSLPCGELFKGRVNSRAERHQGNINVYTGTLCTCIYRTEHIAGVSAGKILMA